MESKTADNKSCPRFSARASACRDMDGEEGECFLADLEQAQQSVNLSSSEIAFAFLIDSHAIALTPLNDLIIAAFKSKYPHGWKEVVCSCFAGVMKKNIKKSLENSS